MDRAKQIQEALQRFFQESGLQPEDLQQALDGLKASQTDPQQSIHASAFSTTLTPLETICTYLSNQDLTVTQIASRTGRRARSVSAALKNAKNKEQRIPPPSANEPRVPLSALRNEALSPAEAVVYDLAIRQQLSNARVAELLGKDPRNTWTLLDRAKKKLGGDAS